MFLVVLDFEGVVVKGEYLLELAKIAGKSDLVEKLTKAGIEGSMNWNEALGQRLELLKGIEYEKCMEATKDPQALSRSERVCGLAEETWKCQVRRYHRMLRYSG